MFDGWIRALMCNEPHLGTDNGISAHGWSSTRSAANRRAQLGGAVVHDHLLQQGPRFARTLLNLQP